MMISKETKNKILSISRIEDVIGDFVDLKKSGLNYRGFSPFSDEKNPSLIVSPQKKIWKDFSSGKGGDIINFLMEHERFSYVEALKYLAKKYQIQINNFFQSQKYTLKKYLFSIHNYAKYFFINQLFFTQEGIKNGLNYLTKIRKFQLEIVRKFELGYAPIYWNRLTEKSLEKGFKLNYLIKSGLVISKNFKNFDYFRSRIIFPIHNLSGYVIGFGGRYLKSELSNVTTKYINSPENDLFQKSKILYGLYQAKKYILKEKICYLVEGYTDVISLYQSGIKNVVSTSGISISFHQILLIKQLTKNIILFYDGDHSGIKATLRTINLLLEQGINLRILFLSNGEDPDSISRKYSSVDELKNFLEINSYHFISFKEKIYEKYHKNDPIKKSILIMDILKSISKVYNSIQKELYIQELSRIFNIRSYVLMNELKRIEKKKICLKSFYPKKNQEDSIIIIENKLIQLIIQYGRKKIKINNNSITVFDAIIYYFKYWNIRFFSKKNQEIFENICIKNNKNIHSSHLKNKTIHYYLSKWDKIGIKVPSEEEKLDQYLLEVLLRYKSLYILKLINKEMIRYNNTEKDNNKKNFLIKRIIYLTKLKNNIHKKLHRYV